MTPVHQLKQEYDAMEIFLTQQGEISLLSDLNRSYRKLMVLSAGSYFEHCITKILIEFANRLSSNDSRLSNFLYSQAISQKYHTLFAWGEKDNLNEPEKKATKFWSCFGSEFKKHIEDELKAKAEDTAEKVVEREKILTSIRAFIEIGHHRNILVHRNLSDFDYPKTTIEVFELYETALPFVSFVEQKLK